MTTANVKPIEFSTKNLNEELANYTMNNVSEAIMYTDKHHRIIYVNKKFEEITGFTFKDVRGKTPNKLQRDINELAFYEKMQHVVHRDGFWQGEIWNRNDGGEIYLQSLTIQARKNAKGQFENFIVIFSDLFDNEIVDKAHIRSSAYYDVLTSLPNRMLFEKRVVSSINQSREDDQSHAVVFFQLGNFSGINEKYGFLFGDMILQRIAARLNHNSYNNFMVTRWNGTEFACIIEDVKNKQQIEDRIQDIQSKISTPIIINGIEVSLSARFGVAIHADKTMSVSEFLSRANTALQKAKEDKAMIRFYETEMGRPSNFFIMELELKRAIKEDQFELFYQPLISVETRELVGFEALIRWVHPTEGIISPIKFIPLAEQTGLIEEIGHIVFEKACRQIVTWRKAGFDHVKIHVNMSMNQFKDQNLVGNIKSILEKTKVSPCDIGVELTESSIIVNMEETITKLHELKNLGLSIAIDDFGTGYSSLGYLIDFPVQRIKIDRSFMKALGKNKKIAAVVTAIIHMGRTMDVEVVAEGIETLEQFEQVQKLKCNAVQGYLFDRPLPKEEVEKKWLSKKVV